MMRIYKYAKKDDKGEFSFIEENGITIDNIVYNLQYIDNMSQEEKKSKNIFDIIFVEAPEGSAIDGNYSFNNEDTGSVTVIQEYIPFDNSAFPQMV